MTSTAAEREAGAHVPDAVERFGRKYKLEYLGMASVFLTIVLLQLGPLPRLEHNVAATAAMFFLFVGLKKKTRDHLVTSFLMFAAAALATPAVRPPLSWSIPFALFAMLAWALEGWVEKRPGRIVTIPAVLGAIGALTLLWPLALVFVGSYVLVPRPDAPALRRKLARLAAAGGAACLIGAAAASRWGFGEAWYVAPPSPLLLAVYAALAIPTALCLAAFWRRLALPHRINALVFGALAPFDERAVALFGIAGTIVLAATVFRQSVESAQLRPHFKRAEWYYFWVILAVAAGLLVGRLAIAS